MKTISPSRLRTCIYGIAREYTASDIWKAACRRIEYPCTNRLMFDLNTRNLVRHNVLITLTNPL